MKRGARKVPRDCYIVRADGEQAVAFVPDSKVAGRWVRTTPAALFRDCPECGAKAGRACLGENGSDTGSHHFRRTQGFRLRREVRSAIRARDERGRILLDRDVAEEIDDGGSA